MTSGPEDAAARGIEALQSAAQEMIAAARAMLDVADDLVRDPRAAGGLLSALDSVVRAANPGHARQGADGDAGRDDDDDDDGGRVQHIPVS